MIARGGPAAAATLRTVSGVNRYADSVGLVALAPGMVIGMAGCAAGSESPTPTETVTVTTTPSPSSAPPSPAPSGSGAAGRSIPDCETLVPLDVVQAQPGWERYEFVGQYLDAAEPAPLPGPVASEVAAGARSRQDCIWGVPNSDSGMGVDILQIDEAAQSKLVSALAAAPDEYTSFSIDGHDAFLTHAPWGIGEGVVVYAFDGGVWVVMGGHEYDQQVATAVVGSALDGIRAANP